MKTRVPMVTAAIAAITLALGSCSDSHETLTPTGPSAIVETAEESATSRTTGYPAAGVQANDEIAGTGDNWQNTGLNRSYTYIEGVPGTPRHVRVRPTGEKAGGSYEVEVSWEPPNWGATDAHTLKMEVVDGTTVKSTSTVAKRPRWGIHLTGVAWRRARRGPDAEDTRSSAGAHARAGVLAGLSGGDEVREAHQFAGDHDFKHPKQPSPGDPWPQLRP